MQELIFKIKLRKPNGYLKTSSEIIIEAINELNELNDIKDKVIIEIGLDEDDFIYELVTVKITICKN